MCISLTNANIPKTKKLDGKSSFDSQIPVFVIKLKIWEMQRVLFFIVFAIHFSGPSKYISSNFQTVHKALKIFFFFSYKENVDLRRHPPSDNGNRPREININEIRKSTRSRKQACRFLRLQNCQIERQQILSTYRMIENEMMASTSYGFSWNSESKLWLPLMNHGRFSLTRTTKRRRHNTTK